MCKCYKIPTRFIIFSYSRIYGHPGKTIHLSYSTQVLDRIIKFCQFVLPFVISIDSNFVVILAIAILKFKIIGLFPCS